VTSQLPVAAWHAYLNEPTLADAILDRLVHNAYTGMFDTVSTSVY
nr:ATP-binding protein [Candidatus Contendobacter sp.]